MHFLVSSRKSGSLNTDHFVDWAPPLVASFLTDPRSQAALIGFDSVPHLVHPYTHSSEDVGQSIKSLEPSERSPSLGHSTSRLAVATAITKSLDKLHR